MQWLKTIGVRIVSLFRKPQSLVAMLDFALAFLLNICNVEFWERIGKYFPRVSGHFKTSALPTFWFAVVIALFFALVPGPIWYAQNLPQTLVNSNGEVIHFRLEKEEGFRALMLYAAGGLLALLTLARGWAEFRLARNRQVSELFTRAVDQLGHNSMDVRLGGIFALEKIAKTYEEYHWTIMEVLTAFIRENAPWQRAFAESDPPSGPLASVRSNVDSIPLDGRRKRGPVQANEKPDEDIQAALTVIRRRDSARDGKSTLNLSNTRLAGAFLIDVSLIDADLSHANLSLAKITNANLSGAWLVNCELANAYLFQTNLSFANLLSAEMPRADLFLANLQRASLQNANLTGAILIEADLTQALVQGANLTEANFWGANLTEVNFRNSNLQRAGLEHSNLTGASLIYANLKEANFWGANLTEANFWGANMPGANFFGANLQRASLQHANLTRASLMNTNLKEANFWGANMTGADFDRANLTEANFHSVYLSEVKNLTWEQLKAADNFGDATLPIYLIDTPEGYEQARLGGANLDGVDPPQAEPV